MEHRPQEGTAFRNISKLLACMAVVSLAGSSVLPAQSAEPGKTAKFPKVSNYQAPAVADEMLMAVRPGSDSDEVMQSIKSVNGTIKKTISNGNMTFYVVDVPKGSLNEGITKLSKDTHFDVIQRNYTSKAMAFPNSAPNDPNYPQQWHLGSLNVPAGWKENGSGTGQQVAIIDTGVNPNETDLAGRVANGRNTVIGGKGNVDKGSNGFFHGTFVATCAVAATNNNNLGAAPGYLVNKIIPIDVFNGGLSATDADIVDGIAYVESQFPNCRLINLSVNADPPFSFTNAAVHPALYAAAQDYYDNHNGIIFNAAGNSYLQCNDPRTTAFVVISAIDENQRLTSFSNYGFSLWFAAPGQDIGTGDVYSKFSFANGTSFSTPLTLGVAAQIMGKHPGWSNTKVLNQMIGTANTNLFKMKTIPDIRYGYGEPDSGAALK